jgi:hypothetical protein
VIGVELLGEGRPTKGDGKASQGSLTKGQDSVYFPKMW